MQLVYLSPVTWGSFAQRPHKFVEWFHDRTGGSVIWVDPYPTRFPNWKDWRRSNLTAPISQPGVVPNWMRVLRPDSLPIEPLPGSGWINRQLWEPKLHQIIDFSLQSDTWLAIGKPSVFALELLKILCHCPAVYDAMDEFPAFYSGLSRLALTKRENVIAESVDTIFASSSKLKQKWEQIHKDVRLVHNGLDLSVIKSVKYKVVSNDKKVFGYLGTIAKWFDWDWLNTLAKARRNDEIRLIGPIFDKPIGKLPNNIKLLEACHHRAALSAIKNFHVGLIPFKTNSLTASVDPIKYYEYRALGLPVMSTNFGEMSFRKNALGVFITQSERDVVAMAEDALQFKGNAEEDQSFAEQNTWRVRFDAAKLLP